MADLGFDWGSSTSYGSYDPSFPIYSSSSGGGLYSGGGTQVSTGNVQTFTGDYQTILDGMGDIDSPYDIENPYDERVVVKTFSVPQFIYRTYYTDGRRTSTTYFIGSWGIPQQIQVGSSLASVWGVNPAYSQFNDALKQAKIEFDSKELMDFLKESGLLYGNGEEKEEYYPAAAVPPPLVDPHDWARGGYYQYNQMLNEQRLTFTNTWINGSMNYWFAGGMLYDAPKAGDIMFHPTGKLPTTKFLGLENENNSNFMEWDGGKMHDYQKKVYGNMAGDNFFGVSPLAQRL